MINVPCILPSIKLIAIALKNMPVIIHTISIIWDSIWLVVLLWHSTWLLWSLLPYVYAQINGYCHYYYPECYIKTHTSTYGTHGRFLETCIVWEKLAVLDFVALGILSPTWWFLYLAPPRQPRKIFSVKCNDGGVITLKPTLTVPCSVLLLKHNKGVEYVKQ